MVSKIWRTYGNEDKDADFEENSDSWSTISNKLNLPNSLLFEDFVNVDSGIIVCTVPSDEDIVQEIQPANGCNDGDDYNNDDEDPTIVMSIPVAH